MFYIGCFEEDCVLNLSDATPTFPCQRFVLQMKSCSIPPKAEHCAHVGANTARNAAEQAPVREHLYSLWCLVRSCLFQFNHLPFCPGLTLWRWTGGHQRTSSHLHIIKLQMSEERLLWKTKTNTTPSASLFWQEDRNQSLISCSACQSCIRVCTQAQGCSSPGIAAITKLCQQQWAHLPS